MNFDQKPTFSNKKWLRRFVIFMISLSCVTIVGSIAFGIYIFVVTQNYQETQLDDKYRKTTFNGVQIYEKNIDNISDNGDPIFFLGKDSDGLLLFIQKIREHLGFGPEFYMLKEIVITQGGENTLITDKADGVYYPTTMQLALNTNQLIKTFRVNKSNYNDYLSIKVELLFQTFYHEYHHHKANIYLTNLEESDKQWKNKSAIYDNRRLIEPWNNHFIENFKRYLKYDVSTPKYTPPGNSPYIYDPHTGGPQTFDAIDDLGRQKRLNLKSIGQLYDAKTLFERANSLTKNYHELQNEFNQGYGYVFSSQYSNWRMEPVDAQMLSYFYSMQELFARKYMQLTMPYIAQKMINQNGTYHSPYDFNSRATHYLFDTLLYAEGFDQKDTYLADRPFFDQEVATNLANLFLLHNGHQDTADISLIWHQNTSRLSFNKLIANEMTQKEVDQIQFGGWLDSTQDHFTHVGYWNENQQFESVKIEIHDYDYNRLVDLASPKRVSLSNKPKFYVTKHSENNGYFDVNFILDKPLYFATNDKGAHSRPLKSFKSLQIGPTWTKRYYSPVTSKIVGKIYQVMLDDNQQVKISRT